MVGVLRAHDERVAGSGGERHDFAGGQLGRSARRGSRDRSRGASRRAPRRCDRASARARCRGAGDSRRRRIRSPTARTPGSAGSSMSQAPARRRDVRARVAAEDRRRLVRRDDASGELVALDELEVLPLVEPIRRRDLCRRAFDAGPVLDVVRRKDRHLGVVLGGDDLRRRVAGDASPSQRIDDDVLLRPGDDGQERASPWEGSSSRRRTDTSRRAPPARSSFRVERRADSGGPQGRSPGRTAGTTPAGHRAIVQSRSSAASRDRDPRRRG